MEARDFRGHYTEFTALGAEVVGVSNDSPDRHASFAESLELPYPLLSDPKGAIAKSFGLARAGGWLPNKRATVVIDREGIVRKVIAAELDIAQHAREALEVLATL
ncbi:MAG: peroxiredoxin [Deltaproteobacteria bacterium]|nr:peroxiredoxin [Deltaproteobacteria bacterium]MBW2396363.1 peroxiredoxin [Deltaproteobacteria bacterium]